MTIYCFALLFGGPVWPRALRARYISNFAIVLYDVWVSSVDVQHHLLILKTVDTRIKYNEQIL